MKPTVGRVVLFYPSAQQREHGWNMPQKGDPLAATIAGVVTDEIVHLSVFDFHGVQRAVQEVMLIDGPAPETPHHGGFAAWMPYQVQQAKKNEAASKDLAMAAAPEVKSSPGLRQHCLDMATKVHLESTAFNSHIDLAREFEQFILGRPDEPPMKESQNG